MSKRKTVVFAGVAFSLVCAMAVSSVSRALADSPSPFHFAVKTSSANTNGQLTGIGPEDAPVRSAVLTQSIEITLRCRKHIGVGADIRGTMPVMDRDTTRATLRITEDIIPRRTIVAIIRPPYVAAYPSYSYFPAPYYSYPPIYTAVPRRAFYAPRGYYYW